MRKKGNEDAVAQMQRVFQRGVQVEWMEVETFLHRQVAVEHGSAQVVVQVAPPRGGHSHEVPKLSPVSLFPITGAGASGRLHGHQVHDSRPG
eukprot:817974-Alexandrium_andersonii.AAC.1